VYPNGLRMLEAAEYRSKRYLLMSGLVASSISSLALTLRQYLLFFELVKRNLTLFPAETSKPSFLSCSPAIT
jgi:hypothetical protein